MFPKNFVRSIGLITLTFLSSLSAQATENNMQPFEIIDKPIVTSPNDTRDYQVIRLANDLQVLLVSDPDLKNSAASLSVPIGSMHNPDSQLGLAHYLEHMLFLGSEKYPIINAYSKFMSQNGGYTNAYTAQDETVYGFEVNDNVFAEALDRLADVMRAPLLDEKYAEKERHTVNAEHKTNYDNDMRKLYALQRYSLNPEHPMSRFSTGDLSTLVDKPNSNLQQALERFFKQYYSANIMKVALTSPRSIEEMQKIAVKYLTQIPNNNVTKPVIITPLITEQQLAVEVKMKPTADLKFLQVNFLVPSLKDEYMYQPGGYISRLLGSDHKGGLSDYLKNKGLTESVGASFYSTQSDEYSQFSMTFKLTQKGLLEQDTVIASLFAYINLIKEKGVNQLQYSQQKKSLDNYFQFLPKNSGFNYVMSLSSTMQKYPLADILSYSFRLDGFKVDFIQQVLNYLTPENSRLFLMSPDAVVDTDIPFYHGQYSKAKIPDLRLQAWLQDAQSIESAMTLPVSNEWLPEDLTLVNEGKNKEALHLVEQPGLSVWMKQSQLNEPKGIYKLQLNNSLNDRSPKDRVKMSLLLDIIQKQLSDLSFITQEAGLGFSVSNSNGLFINTRGYSDKQSQLLFILLDHIHQLRVDEQTLNLSKQELKRRLKNRAKSKPMDLALDGFRKVIRQPAWSDKTLLAQIEHVTPADLLSLVDEIFSQSSVRLLALGNFSTVDVLSVTDQLKKKIQIQENAFYKIKRLNAEPKQGPLNFSRHSDKEDDALVSVYLAKSEGAISFAKAELLNKLLKPAFYNQIRTQEQLTYSPFTASFEVEDSIAFGLFTQSPAIGSAALYGRFKVFLENFKVTLMQTKEDDFEEIKHAHIANYLTKPNSLGGEFSYLTNEWMDNKKEIDTKLDYVHVLEAITLKQVQDYYSSLFFDDKNTQQIIVQVKGKNFVKEAPLTLPQQMTILDIDRLSKGELK
ncbi:insulinase family protein [Psychromonas algicola]|uniref:insulinase family protein n=1 Tax=Psychromonas algicola TaxID=2555642 RepID=UPI0010683504|nr:insulinase family protein [Psychromonas sp. RZ5]TEW52233.1 peptidase M16 [Psychromonas sp. RZ5]